MSAFSDLLRNRKLKRREKEENQEDPHKQDSSLRFLLSSSNEAELNKLCCLGEVMVKAAIGEYLISQDIFEKYSISRLPFVQFCEELDLQGDCTPEKLFKAYVGAWYNRERQKKCGGPLIPWLISLLEQGRDTEVVLEMILGIERNCACGSGRSTEEVKGKEQESEIEGGVQLPVTRLLGLPAPEPSGTDGKQSVTTVNKGHPESATQTVKQKRIKAPSEKKALTYAQTTAHNLPTPPPPPPPPPQIQNVAKLANQTPPIAAESARQSENHTEEKKEMPWYTSQIYEIRAKGRDFQYRSSVTDHEVGNGQTFRWDLYLDGKLLGTGLGPNKKEAKHKASKDGWEKLKAMNFKNNKR